MPILIDTSLWVHQLRRSGNPHERDRVNALLRAGEAAWCAPIRLELWRGVTNDTERKVLRDYGRFLPDIPITPQVWDLAIRAAERGRAAGQTFPMADLLVFACGRVHGIGVIANDEHFDRLARLKL